MLQLYGMLKPAAAAAPAAQPRRVHMELPAPAGASARRNMPTGLAVAAPPDRQGDSAAVHDAAR